MAAIVTDPFKKQLTQTVFNEVTNTTARYYIGIGRSEQWDSSETVPDPTDSPRWINQVHMEAWKLGVKTLYYLRTDSVIKGDLGSRTADFVSCDG